MFLIFRPKMRGSTFYIEGLPLFQVQFHSQCASLTDGMSQGCSVWDKVLNSSLRIVYTPPPASLSLSVTLKRQLGDGLCCADHVSSSRTIQLYNPISAVTVSREQRLTMSIANSGSFTFTTQTFVCCELQLNLVAYLSF